MEMWYLINDEINSLPRPCQKTVTPCLVVWIKLTCQKWGKEKNDGWLFPIVKKRTLIWIRKQIKTHYKDMKVQSFHHTLSWKLTHPRESGYKYMVLSSFKSYFASCSCLWVCVLFCSVLYVSIWVLRNIVMGFVWLTIHFLRVCFWGFSQLSDME